jgi:hypothetical protein
MVAGASHRFQRWTAVLLVAETVASGIYEQATPQPKAARVTVAVATFSGSNDLYTTDSTPANKPTDYQPIPSFSHTRLNECLRF